MGGSEKGKEYDRNEFVQIKEKKKSSVKSQRQEKERNYPEILIMFFLV